MDAELARAERNAKILLDAGFTSSPGGHRGRGEHRFEQRPGVRLGEPGPVLWVTPPQELLLAGPPMQPGFPAGGGYDASVLVQPDGQLDALIWGHHLNPLTYKVHPGHEFFMSSWDAGRTWSPLLKIGPAAGSIAVPTWWIDGDLGMDRAGFLYATWDTQTARGDIGWISYSTDHGSTWSAPLRVTSDHDNAMHNVEVAGAGPGVADVAWQAGNSPHGYATYLRPFSIARGWLAPATRVSTQFGNKKIWPGDTFGISVPSSDRVVLSWGSAIKKHKDSQIYVRVVRLPHRA